MYQVTEIPHIPRITIAQLDVENKKWNEVKKLPANAESKYNELLQKVREETEKDNEKEEERINGIVFTFNDNDGAYFFCANYVEYLGSLKMEQYKERGFLK